jgi:site-specific DNA-methyltransferase (adenine-specific)
MSDNMINLMLGDCLERMKEIPDGSVDMILTDPPYGTTACKWDSIIPLEPMWEQLERITRPNAMIVMTASQPFTTKLISSNINNFSHQWVWDKKMSANPLLSKKMPMKNFEDIIVFCFNYNQHDERRKYFKSLLGYIGKPKSHVIKDTNQGLDHCFRCSSMQFDLPTELNYKLLTDTFNLKDFYGYLDYSEIQKHLRVYNPQMVKRGAPVKKGFKGRLSEDSFMGAVDIDTRAFNNTYYPQSILQISNRQKGTVHPTQKPVALMEYLIKTYTNESETVLDFTMGSGSTGVAAKNLNRKFIGIEMDEGYFKIAKNRINNE